MCLHSQYPGSSPVITPTSGLCGVFGTLALMPGQAVVHGLLPGRCLGHKHGPDILNWFSKYISHNYLWSQMEKRSRDRMEWDVVDRGEARSMSLSVV